MTCVDHSEVHTQAKGTLGGEQQKKYIIQNRMKGNLIDFTSSFLFSEYKTLCVVNTQAASGAFTNQNGVTETRHKREECSSGRCGS